MKSRPNIVLISLDTVRADHLSCYGYKKQTTPNIDRLAEDGVLFKNAYSTAVWTPPAHASMLTGLYPSEHGVIDQNRLSPDLPTIAETLIANGYHTAGFVNNSQVGQLVGLDKGHETFVEVWHGTVTRNIIEKGIRYFGRKVFEISGLKDHGARKTNQLAIKWLKEVSTNDKPFFLFLHYIDAHNPLKAPFPYRNKFIKKELKSKIDQKKVRLMAKNPLYYYTKNIKLNENENEILIGLYDGEIAYLDKKVGEIFDHLRNKNLYDNTLIIITSDHGEHFGEHGHYSHVSSLYQPIIHVPLIFRFPEIFNNGKQIKEIVQIIDILPTITDLLKVAPSNFDKVSGKSLLSSNYHFHKFAISEWEGRVPYFVLRDLNCDEFDARITQFKSKMWTIQDDNHKYICSSDGSEELYNIEIDPQEVNNLSNTEKKKALFLKSKLEEWKSLVSQRSVYNLRYETDKATRKNLESLGYI